MASPTEADAHVAGGDNDEGSGGGGGGGDSPARRPPSERKVHIPVRPHVSLQGWLFQPPSDDSGDARPDASALRGVVLMHPHPKLGGEAYHNNVMAALSHALASSTYGFTVLAFNSRGHGGSTGASSWRGTVEREDVLGAARWLHARLGERSSIAVVGYSFGAAVCGAALGQLCRNAGGAPAWLRAYVAISYPCGLVSRMLLGAHFAPTVEVALPKLWVCGTRDQFSTATALGKLFARLPEPKDKAVLSGGDHFWAGMEAQLAATVGMWLRSCWAAR